MTNHPKILLFYEELKAAGGAERLLFEEERYFRKRGINSSIVTFSLNTEALFDYRPEEIEVIKAGKSCVSRIFELRKRLIEINPDLIITLPSISLYIATLFTSIPYITHIHGTIFWFPRDTSKYALIYRNVFSEVRNSVIGHKEFIPIYPRCNIMNRIALEFLAIMDYLAVRKSIKIITLTDQLKWEIKKIYDRDAIVARGCLSEMYFPHMPNEDIREKLGIQNNKVILNIGRLDPRKRIDVLIKSFAKILPNNNSLILLIGGTGEEKDKLERLAEGLGIKEKVKFLGFISDSQLYDYYAACDVYAFPSWTSSGITPYEALAVGKKVVWTSEADEPVLGDKHVFVAEPNEEDFAKALEKALNTEAEGKVNLSEYTWDAYFKTVYDAAIRAIS